MENKDIPDAQITASSERNANHGASNGRLNFMPGGGKTGSWSAGANDGNQWLQVDIGQSTMMTGIKTQGRQDYDQWVTSYTVSYSKDGTTFTSYNQNAVLQGNEDRNTVVSHVLSETINARYIRVHPKTWHGHISMRMELLGCPSASSPSTVSPQSSSVTPSSSPPACSDPLGMENKDIPDAQITASSESNANHGASNGRLNFMGGGGKSGSWTTTTLDSNQWLQVDLGQSTMITGIKTQGRQDRDQWVTTYTVSYSKDGTTFTSYNQNVVFQGNKDRSTVVLHVLSATINTRYIRVHPKTWYGRISMRMELLGCPSAAAVCFIKAVGVEDSSIVNNNKMTASSEYGGGFAAEKGRLHGNKAWCPQSHNSNQDWLSIELEETTEICGVATQGYEDDNEYVIDFKLSYSPDGSAWTTYTDADGSEKEFTRVGDSSTIDQQTLPVPISAKFIRFHPITQNGWNCLRVEMYIPFVPESSSTIVQPSPSLQPSQQNTAASATPPPTQSPEKPSMTLQPSYTVQPSPASYPLAVSSSHPVHGNWSNWSLWPNCNKPCNQGSKTRKRLCDNPEPANGGRNCEGPATESEPCNPDLCQPDDINYDVKFTAKTWSADLAVKGSSGFTDLEKKIVQYVTNFYSTMFQEVVCKVLWFREGSVIVSFNVTYMAVDSLQIVALQEQIDSGGTFGEDSAELLNISSTYVPGEAPVILEAKSPTSTTIDIKWTEVTQLNSANLKGYGIVYKKIGEKFQVGFLKSVLPTPPEATLEDLEKFSNYTIRVFAFTNLGNGVSSQPFSLPTLEDVPSQTPPNTIVQSTSSSTIDVSWEAIDQAYVHGILLGYEVRYAKHDGSPLVWETKTLDHDTNKITLSDLEYFTRYKVVVCAKTSKGCGKEYSAISYTWGDVPDKPPQSLTADNLTSEATIPVQWSPVPNGHVKGLLMGYSIKYQRIRTAEGSVFDRTEEETMIVKPNQIFILLPVETYSTYSIKVAAFTQAGMGPYTEYVYAESCRCPKILYTNYWSTFPYLKVTEDDKLEGLFSGIVTDMVHTACGYCPAYGDTTIEMKRNGKGGRAAKKGILEVLADFDEVPQIMFPIYGNQYVTTYMGTNAYINLVESPGIAFIATARPPGEAATNMITAVLETVPLMVLSACFAYISGFVIWLLDSKSNPDEFPPSFMKGVGEGFWWSFVSMTTVGYGDRSPRSIAARIFSIAWTLTGLVIIGILVGAIASSLTSVNVQKDITLYGTKVGAIHNSSEYRLGILKNAKVNTEHKYTNLDEIRAALEDGEIDGALLDTYVAAENKGTLLDDRVFVKDILDYPFGYGVVLSGTARNVEQRCRDYISLHISEIFKIIENKTKTLDASDGGISESTGLFDPTSQMFIMAVASLLGLLGVAIIIGLLYQFLVYVPGIKKGINLKDSSSHCAYKESLVKEMKEFVDAFYSKMSSKIPLIIEMKKRELREINRITKYAKKDKKFFKSAKNGNYSLENMHCNNPVYSSTSIPDDPPRKCVHYVTAKSILEQSREWPTSSSRADDTVSVYSACPAMTSMDYQSVNPGDVKYEDNRKAIEY